MIQNEMKKVSVITFTSGTDEYGQLNKNGSTEKIIDMFIRPYGQTETADVRFMEVELIGLTKNKELTDRNNIRIGQQTYQVLYVIPSRRYNQVLMKRV